jgi:dCMP deaminase
VFALKREEYLSWDEYFMGVASLSAMRSKDPSTQVGACIVNADKRIISMGYNGMPRQCSDDEFPWDREGNPLDSKYLFVCHAELNAILNSAGGSVRGCTVYTTLFPCNECAKAIFQAGITEVVYMSDKYATTDSTLAAKKMFDTAGVTYRPYNIANKKVNIEL